MLIVNLFDKNIELFIAFADKKWGGEENVNISDTFLWLNASKSLFYKEIASWLVILCYSDEKNKCLKFKLKNYPLNLSLIYLLQ